MAESIDMSDFPRIINTETISTETDVFWAENQHKLQDLIPKEVAVITTTYQPKSTEEIQLNKIIEACKMDSDKYNIVMLNTDEKLSWQYIKNTIQPRIVISFGVLPKQLGIAALFRLNTPNKFDDMIFIPALAISDLEQNIDSKKELWNSALKPTFIDNI